MKASPIVVGICIFLVLLLGTRLYGLWHRQDLVKKGSIVTVCLLGAYCMLLLLSTFGFGLSEPAKLNITNTLAEEVKLYPLLFYRDTHLACWADKGVGLAAGQSQTLYAETEGSRDMWVVALDRSNTAVYLHKLDQGFMHEYRLMIEKNHLPDKNSAAVALAAIHAAEGTMKQNIAFMVVDVLLLALLTASLWMRPKNAMNKITRGVSTAQAGNRTASPRG